jgi:DNA-binding NtrC family response regulator
MEDVPVLAEHFLRQYAEKYERSNAGISQRCFDRMLQYHWRGNVRELQNTIERAVLLSRDGLIDKLDLPAGENGYFDQPEFEVPIREYAVNEQSLVGVDESTIFETTGRMIVDRLPEVTTGAERKDVFDQVEKSIAVAALRRTGGNKQAAANLLGIYRPRLYGILKRHDITDTE